MDSGASSGYLIGVGMATVLMVMDVFTLLQSVCSCRISITALRGGKEGYSHTKLSRCGALSPHSMSDPSAKISDTEVAIPQMSLWS